MAMINGNSGVLLDVVDVQQVVQPLVAGANVISVPLGTALYDVEVLNAANGNRITHSLTAMTTSTFTVTVGVAVASARIIWDR